VFTTFDSEQCRWRVEHGDESSDCTTDESGHPRWRGWVKLRCNPDTKERAALVAVNELAACEFEAIVESPEVCPPSPPTRCNEDGLKGATATGSFVERTWTVDLFKVRALNVCTQATQVTGTPRLVLN
jgi:hypothetical protein